MDAVKEVTVAADLQERHVVCIQLRLQSAEALLQGAHLLGDLADLLLHPHQLLLFLPLQGRQPVRLLALEGLVQLLKLGLDLQLGLCCLILEQIHAKTHPSSFCKLAYVLVLV